MSKLTTAQQSAVNAYDAFLKTGATYGQAMREAAKSLGGTPCPTFLGELAKVHAKRYECNYTWNTSGSAVFYNGDESTRETRNDSARKSWERNVMVWFKPEREAAPKSSARISREAREAAKAYLAQFESVKDAIAALKAIA
jgi:hypothetical protein